MYVNRFGQEPHNCQELLSPSGGHEFSRSNHLMPGIVALVVIITPNAIHVRKQVMCLITARVVVKPLIVRKCI
jgi:hypothetical protein